MPCCGSSMLTAVWQHIIWVFFTFVCLLRMKYMVGHLGFSIDKWLFGSSEPPWVLGQFVALTVFTTIEWVGKSSR